MEEPVPQIEKVKNWITSQAWVAILVTFLTIALGIVLSEIQVRIGWSILIVSLVTVVGIYGIVTWLNLRYVFSVSVTMSQNIQDTLDKYIGLEKIGWMLTTPQLVKLEEKTKAPEIWLISSDLAEDMVGKPFFSAVDKNLKRGIKYKFFVPDQLETRSRILQLTNRHKNAENFEVIYLNSDFFFLVPEFDFAIYNPRAEGDAERMGYMGIPACGEERHHHARVSDTLIDVLIGKLILLMDN